MKAILFFSILFVISFNSKSQTNSVIKDGDYVLYHKNGNVKAKGNFSDNKREGEWTYYHENGNIALKKNYTKGEQTGEWAYFSENGSLAMKVQDISKIQDKTELIKIEDGIVVRRSVFVNGKRSTDNDDSVIKDKF
jgi:antitoxin component YwqK of YwqJK toxin-antitoxin module